VERFYVTPASRALPCGGLDGGRGNSGRGDDGSGGAGRCHRGVGGATTAIRTGRHLCGSILGDEGAIPLRKVVTLARGLE
jgi:hypothetical protein